MSNVTDKQKELLKKFNSTQGKIETCLSKIKKTAQETIGLAIENGGILIELKDTFKHGEWLEFRQENIPQLKDRQCQMYINLNKNQEVLENAGDRVFKGIDDAGEYISEQKRLEADKKAISNIAKNNAEAVKRRDSVPSVEPVNNHTRAEDIVKKRKATRRKNDANRRKYIALTMKQKKHIYELIGTVETVYGESDIPDDLHNWLKQGKEILNGIESELSNAA